MDPTRRRRKRKAAWIKGEKYFNGMQNDFTILEEKESERLVLCARRWRTREQYEFLKNCTELREKYAQGWSYRRGMLGSEKISRMNRAEEDFNYLCKTVNYRFWLGASLSRLFFFLEKFSIILCSLVQFQTRKKSFAVSFGSNQRECQTIKSTITMLRCFRWRECRWLAAFERSIGLVEELWRLPSQLPVLLELSETHQDAAGDNDNDKLSITLSSDALTSKASSRPLCMIKEFWWLNQHSPWTPPPCTMQIVKKVSFSRFYL